MDRITEGRMHRGSKLHLLNMRVEKKNNPIPLILCKNHVYPCLENPQNLIWKIREFTLAKMAERAELTPGGIKLLVITRMPCAVSPGSRRRNPWLGPSCRSMSPGGTVNQMPGGPVGGPTARRSSGSLSADTTATISRSYSVVFWVWITYRNVLD